MAKQPSGRFLAAIFLIFSMLAAGVASLVIYSVIQNYQAELDSSQVPHETVNVLVAARHLYPGTMIKSEDLQHIEMPPAYVPEGA